MNKISYKCPFCKKECNTIIQWQTVSISFELDLTKHEYKEQKREGGDIEAWCCPYCEKELPSKLLNTLDMRKKNPIKEYKGTVIVVEDNQLLENFPFTDEAEANNIFLEQCRSYISNFDEYSRTDIDNCLTQGKEIFGHGEIKIWWF